MFTTHPYLVTKLKKTLIGTSTLVDASVDLTVDLEVYAIPQKTSNSVLAQGMKTYIGVDIE